MTICSSPNQQMLNENFEFNNEMSGSAEQHYTAFTEVVVVIIR